MTHPKSSDESLYAGRWVARVRGRVIAQGGTPEQARRAARTHRHKENPEIIFMHPLESLFISPLLDAVRASAEQPVHLVGGSVRDALMSRVVHDLDFVVPTNAIKLARRVANNLNATFYVMDEASDTARVIVTSENGIKDILDFTSYRGPDLEADLRARDFTINAIALDLASRSLYDPLSGVLDIRAKVIRHCSPESFANDPLRILRAVRQAAAFGFNIDKATRTLMRQSIELIPNASPERQRDELFKMLAGPQPATALRALEILGVLPYFLPEMPALKGVEQSAPHVHDVWTHTLKVLDHLEMILSVLAPGYSADSTNDLFTGLLTLRLGRYREQIAAHFALPLNADRSVRALLFLAALYHDVAKPATKTFDGERLRFFEHDERGVEMAEQRARAFGLSNDEVERLKIIIGHHMRLHNHTARLITEKKEPTRRAIYRFFRDAGEGGVDLVLLALADVRATYDHTLTQEHWTACLDVCRLFLEAWWEKKEVMVMPPQLLNGNDLINEMKMKPGREIGELLEALRENQAMGNITTREGALTFARGWLANNRVRNENEQK